MRDGHGLSAVATPRATGGWPRITLITPVLNGVQYVESTIRSVLSQGYPNLEYIVVDGGSTDGTLEILERYKPAFAGWISEPDGGMYDALNKGFALSTGDIMGWISGTDMLHVGSLFTVGSVFRQLPDVEWITGIPTGFTEEGMVTGVGRPPRWSRTRFLAGANRYLQQESTFWRRRLWERAGGYMDATFRVAGDFELWARFFRYAPVYPVHALIGGFRAHHDSLGTTELAECHRVHDRVVEREVRLLPPTHPARLLRRMDQVIRKVPKVRGVWARTVSRWLYTMPGWDWPPVVEYQPSAGWVLRRSTFFRAKR